MAEFKQMPHNIEAEQATLGALLISEIAVAQVVNLLEPDDFYRQDHSIIYSSIIDLYRKKISPDIVTVADDLENKNLLEKAGGLVLLTMLFNMVPTKANVMHYAQIVKEKSFLRKIAIEANIVKDKAYNCDDVNEIMSYVYNNLACLNTTAKNRQFVNLYSELVEVLGYISDYQAGELDEESIIQTGFIDIDNLIHGFAPGNFIILAARPSMGKTAFAMNIALNAVFKDKHVAFFTLEMSAKSLLKRAVSSMSKIDWYNDWYNNNNVNSADIERLTKCVEKLSAKTNFHICDSEGIKISELRQNALKLKIEGCLDFIVIDYLQLIRVDDEGKEMRYLEVDRISRELKCLAKELDVPILCLAQLNRGVESRDNKRPLLSDLRESGSLEQDADIVMFIYRDEYYNQKPENKGKAEIIIAKHREGPTGRVELGFNAKCTAFVNLAPLPFSGELQDKNVTKEAKELFKK